MAMIVAGCAPVSSGSRADVAAASRARPNIIVIVADDLGYADISAYGVERIKTPNIDRIGNEGVKFTDGYASAPVCAPSRAGLQTGRYQQRFGFEFNNGPGRRDAQQNLGLDPKEITIAQALKGVGYHTGIVGKWHLGSNADYYPTNRGYDEFVGILTGATSYIDPDVPGVEIYHPRGDASINGAGLMRRSEFNQVFEGAEKRIVHNEKEYLTDYFGRRAVDYIDRNAKAADPYFLYLAFNAPHDPFMVTKKYYDRFPQIADRQMRIYAAMISALDDQVGQVLDAVERSGEADDTMVVFLSDNGCAAYFPGLCACEPLRGGKLTHYEGGVRVPYMIRWPRAMAGGQVYREPVTALDIFPTAMAAGGAALANDRTYDGVDLLPFLTGEKQGTPHDALMWRRAPMVSIRKGDWKLWKHLDGDFTLLFNLRDDPNEQTNLAERHPDKLRELEQGIEQWSKDLQDPKWPTKTMIEYDVCGTPLRLPV
ncbi:sulfatase-like hydrolase/transferase [Hephaestia sp. GCM10023244]|uniref:sulfatase-like hydrolase/transferase n=1 Tax=unclassified Hephaestia TaxID=2631281 RepID=UPI002077927F|nr:sulfatase-like hydrolase/transferase [Hephaestia sp. MAHUQ-44]MCM8732494.1 sulfatase-like hydrolase/transferase [Hephaestia sp. MAHUQ-44]